jgi:hypothetical protein
VHFVVVFNLTRFARDKYDHFALRSLLQSLGISLRSATPELGRWTFLVPIGYLNAPRAMGKSLMADPERAPPCDGPSKSTRLDATRRNSCSSRRERGA